MKLLLSALCALLMSVPVLAAPPTAMSCPLNGQPYSFKGSILKIDVTSEGRLFYVVSAASCGDERHQIKVFPLAPVPACAVGRRAQASGLFGKSCTNSDQGPTCLAQLGLSSPYGAILSCN